jgi:hypothetical protein
MASKIYFLALSMSEIFGKILGRPAVRGPITYRLLVIPRRCDNVLKVRLVTRSNTLRFVGHDSHFDV